jgi:hypothetical protein
MSQQMIETATLDVWADEARPRRPRFPGEPPAGEQ